jgi:hypothetical protein
MSMTMLRRARWRGLGLFVRRFPQIHLGIGLLGNGLFITGTLLFMTRHQGQGVYFFLVGSCGMFLGSLGEVLRAVGRRKLARYDIDPRYPDQRWSQEQSRSSAID